MMKLVLAAVAALLICAGCSASVGEGGDEFGKALCESVLAGDEAAFVRLHYMKGDALPGEDPGQAAGEDDGAADKEWDDAVLETFKRSQNWVAIRKSEGEELAFDQVLKVDVPAASSEEQKHLSRIHAVYVGVKGTNNSFVMKTGPSILTQRGRVAVEIPGVEFLTWEQYETGSNR